MRRPVAVLETKLVVSSALHTTMVSWFGRGISKSWCVPVRRLLVVWGYVFLKILHKISQAFIVVGTMVHGLPVHHRLASEASLKRQSTASDRMEGEDERHVSLGIVGCYLGRFAGTWAGG